jgi:hypothetical protein
LAAEFDAKEAAIEHAKTQAVLRGINAAVSGFGRAARALAKGGGGGGLASAAAIEQDKADNLQFKINATEFDDESERDHQQSLTSINGDGNEWRNKSLERFDSRANRFIEKQTSSVVPAAKTFIRRRTDEHDRLTFNTMHQYRQKWAFDETGRIINERFIPTVPGELDNVDGALKTIDGIALSADPATPTIKDALRVQATAAALKEWRQKAGVDAGEQAQSLYERYRTEDLPDGDDVPSRFARAVVETRGELIASSAQLQRDINIEDAQNQAKLEEDTRRSGLDLFHQGNLTHAWVENRDSALSQNDEGLLFGILSKTDEGITDAPTVTDLRERATMQPQLVMDEAAHAYNGGLLSRGDFDNVYLTAKSAQSDERPGWVNEQRTLLMNSIRPTDDADEAEWEHYNKTLSAYDMRAADLGKDADQREFKAHTDTIIKNYTTGKADEARRKLPVPRYSEAGRDAISLDHVENARGRLVMALGAGEISDEEAGQEWENLKHWQRALEMSGEKLKPDFKMGKMGLGGPDFNPYEDALSGPEPNVGLPTTPDEVPIPGTGRFQWWETDETSTENIAWRPAQRADIPSGPGVPSERAAYDNTPEGKAFNNRFVEMVRTGPGFGDSSDRDLADGMIQVLQDNFGIPEELTHRILQERRPFGLVSSDPGELVSTLMSWMNNARPWGR